MCQDTAYVTHLPGKLRGWAEADCCVPRHSANFSKFMVFGGLLYVHNRPKGRPYVLFILRTVFRVSRVFWNGKFVRSRVFWNGKCIRVRYAQALPRCASGPC